MVALDSVLDKSKKVAITAFKVLNGEKALYTLFNDVQGSSSLLLPCIIYKVLLCSFRKFVSRRGQTQYGSLLYSS